MCVVMNKKCFLHTVLLRHTFTDTLVKIKHTLTDTPHISRKENVQFFFITTEVRTKFVYSQL